MSYGTGEKFDREKHRFGMAYECSRDSSKPYYPTTLDHCTGCFGSICFCVDQHGKNLGSQWQADLKRWPLFDMVPALQVAIKESGYADKP